MIVAIASNPNPQDMATTIAIASATVSTVVNFLTRSIRCPPVTVDSNAAPTLAMPMMIARRNTAPDADSRNSGGTPANRTIAVE